LLVAPQLSVVTDTVMFMPKFNKRGATPRRNKQEKHYVYQTSANSSDSMVIHIDDWVCEKQRRICNAKRL
jgi:hypothetical protein